MKKLLEFIYTGMTTIGFKDEAAFINMLSDLEIGGTKSRIVTELTNVQSVEDGVSLELNKPYTTLESQKNLKCEICGQVLKTRTGLRMHLLVHQGSKGKVFTCDVCGKGIHGLT